MGLVVEPRHGIVGLRRKSGLRDAAGIERLEYRKTAAPGQPMDQRGDEHGLAGARQAGDAEPHRRVEKALAIVQQRPRRQPRFLDDIGETRGHAGEGSKEGVDASQKVAI